MLAHEGLLATRTTVPRRSPVNLVERPKHKSSHSDLHEVGIVVQRRLSVEPRDHYRYIELQPNLPLALANTR